MDTNHLPKFGPECKGEASAPEMEAPIEHDSGSPALPWRRAHAA